VADADRVLKHDPEKCVAVLRKDHAQTRSKNAKAIQPNAAADGQVPANPASKSLRMVLEDPATLARSGPFS
jgi:hypothetical protein